VLDYHGALLSSRKLARIQARKHHDLENIIYGVKNSFHKAT